MCFFYSGQCRQDFFRNSTFTYIHLLLHKICPEQESPPAWTQKAYRPRHIKYSICCPIWGGGGTYLGQGGTYFGFWGNLPQLGCTYLGQGITYLGQGGTYLGRGYLSWGTTHPDLAGGYLPWPGGTYLGVPSCLDLAGVPPPTGVDRQTPVKTIPYRRTTYAVGNNSQVNGLGPWDTRNHSTPQSICDNEPQ